MPYYRKRKRSSTEDRPPGLYVSWLLLTVAVLSVAGGCVAALVLPGVTAKVTAVASTLPGAALFAGMWALLKNVRQMNAALQDENASSDSG